MSESGDPVQARCGPLVAAGVLAVLGVLVASTIGVLASQLGCIGDPQGAYAHYCQEHAVADGRLVTLAVLGPPVLTAVAAVASVRQRRYRTLEVVALVMLLAGLVLPTLIWVVAWGWG